MPSSCSQRQKALRAEPGVHGDGTHPAVPQGDDELLQVLTGDRLGASPGVSAKAGASVRTNVFHAVSYQTSVLGLTFFRPVRSRRNRSRSEFRVAKTEGRSDSQLFAS